MHVNSCGKIARLQLFSELSWVSTITANFNLSEILTKIYIEQKKVRRM